MCRSNLIQNYIIQNAVISSSHRSCSVKKHALKCFAEFTGRKASGPATLLKRDSNRGAFLRILHFFKENLVYRIFTVAAFENNEKQQLSEGFANSYYKIVSPILLQKIINNFSIYKHCSGTLLIVEDVTSNHGIGN